MIAETKIDKIKIIWNNYASSDQAILDTKGKELPNIDQARTEAIIQLKQFIKSYNSDEIDIYEFKTTVDSFNNEITYGASRQLKVKCFSINQ